ncbi:matrix extracellular phosphoglycoprotein [Limosa lapponica baueri]|uniref:Matrix extracellular phosphoglycoprotein n=1 Tax=Limosa lapponica baueri TaxID=1758121 RepID=A0A2I0TZ76_LIMLA|nr:matrix extracellular phosphoglycoprotein [Limosa lapponica baueri]
MRVMLTTASSTPWQHVYHGLTTQQAILIKVPPPLPGRATGNCVGQHRILLKGCNAKHGFYVFKYVYSFSTRRNQTQIKKEEADSQSVVASRQLSEDKTDDEAAPEQGDNDSTDAMENGIVLKPENHSTPGVASSEGSGDLDLVIEVNSSVSVLPQSPGEAMERNRSDVRSEDRDDGAPRGIPVEGAMTAGRQRAPTTGGAGDEGSGEATIPGQGQDAVVQGTETGGAALTSVTEKMENVQVDAEGVDEYAYIPGSGSFTVTHGKAGSTAGVTSFTQISPDKDDEVNIFIGRANIHVGEQENTQAGATIGSDDDGISTAGTSSPLPRLGITVTHNGDDDDGIPAQRQPEVPATTATLSPRDSTTTSPRDGYPTGDDEDGATIIGDGEGQVAPSPWRVTGSDITVPVEAGMHGNGDDDAKGEAQKFEGRPGHMAVTTPHQGGDKEATATVPAKGASIRLGTTVASPGVSKGDCTTTLGMAGGRKARLVCSPMGTPMWCPANSIHPDRISDHTIKQVQVHKQGLGTI